MIILWNFVRFGHFYNGKITHIPRYMQIKSKKNVQKTAKEMDISTRNYSTTRERAWMV